MNEPYYRDVLDRLRKDIREIEAKESEAREHLEAIQLRLADIRKAADSVSRLLGEEPSELSLRHAASPAESGATVTHADIAEEVLRAIGRSARVSEITKSMAERGHPLPADERIRDSAVYSAMLRRPGIFSRVGRGLWALVEWDQPDDR